MLSGAAIRLHYRRHVRRCYLIHLHFILIILYWRCESSQKLLLATFALRGDDHEVIIRRFDLPGTGLTLDQL